MTIFNIIFCTPNPRISEECYALVINLIGLFVL